MKLFNMKNKPIFGTQFHPEMSLDGQELIEKFFVSLIDFNYSENLINLWNKKIMNYFYLCVDV